MADQFNYSETFGSLSYCACEDCRSIYSPAAYLTDILSFINKSDRDTYLLAATRRPDLGEIKLSCANTSTPMPYIDLVNEVLEYAVAVKPTSPPTAPTIAPAPAWWQTTGTASDVAASPEHIIQDAYTALGQAIYSWTLPFDLWAAQARVYLEKLGVKRADLMETFQDQKGITFKLRQPESWAGPTDVEIGTEYLGIAPAERRVITARLSVHPVSIAVTATPALHGLQLLDGVQLAEGDRVLVAAGTDPKNGIYVVHTGPWQRPPDADAATLHDGVFASVAKGTQAGNSWVLTTKEPFTVDSGAPSDALTFVPFVQAGEPDTLAAESSRAWYADSEQAGVAADRPHLITEVRHLLDRSGLEFQELHDLLQTRFVNPGTKAADLFAISFADDAPCDVDQASFKKQLDDSVLSRLHRFVRLRRKLGWTSRELDQAIAALNAPDLTDRFLLHLAHIQRLKDELNVPLLELLAWWSALDITRDVTLAPSFYEQTFQNPAVMPADSVTAFNLDAARKDVDGTPPIALQHKPGIIAALGISADDLELLLARLAVLSPNPLLNLANLSWLFRHASLARALRRPITELLSLLDLTGIDPFDPAHPASTRRLVLTSQQVTASKFSVPELDYLLRDLIRVEDEIAPAAEAVNVALQDLRAGLRKIIADTPPDQDPAGAQLRSKLASYLAPADLDEAMKVLDGTSASPAKSITDHFGDFADPLDAIEKLVTNPLQPVAARYAYLTRWLLGAGLVAQRLAASFKLDTAVASLLVRKGLQSPKGTRSALAELLDPAFITADTDSATIEKTYRKIAKAALVLQHFRVTADRLGNEADPAWLATHAKATGWLDLDALPLNGGVAIANPDPALFEGWRRLADLTAVWDAQPNGAPSFFTILDLTADLTANPTVDPFLTSLAARTGWKLDDLQSLASGLGLVYPDDYRDERCVVRFAACARLLRKLRVSAAQVLGWRDAAINSGTPAAAASQIIQATKARFDTNTWQQAAGPLQDIIRQQRRDALVAFLTSQGSAAGQIFKDSDGLFEWYLLDVEVTPVVVTSRIKQAIGSVQLFIQRSIMNLEPGVSMDADSASHWLTWMKSEQFWEANRKVFLYPENWIEEDLLPSPTPFFQDLVNDLLQREVTLDSAEDAYRKYLDQLEQVARLEIVGMFHQLPSSVDGAEILHVFGRTFNDPHIYFYRTLTYVSADAGTWSPWEKVDLDIQSDQIIPVIYNRRLHLFWPVFAEKVDHPKAKDQNSTHLEVQLAWSEYRNGRWLRKKVSTAVVGTGATEALLDPANGTLVYSFQGLTDTPGELRVRVRWLEQGQLVGDIYQVDVHEAAFDLVGCTGTPTALGLPTQDASAFMVPSVTAVDGMQFAGVGLPQPATLAFTLADGTTAELVRHQPSDFWVLYPHQYQNYWGNDSFFYQDAQRTFFARYLGQVLRPIFRPWTSIADINLTAVWVPYVGEAPQEAVNPPRDASVALVDTESIAQMESTGAFGGKP